MDGLLHVGKWPRTDAFVYATSSCDNVKAFHTLGQRYGIPAFGMERPYHPFTPRAMEHWREEHKRLIAFLEEKTGKKLDYDRLKETVRLSYRLTEVALEIDDLVPMSDADVRRMLRRRAAGASTDVEPRRPWTSWNR
jgi:benzoyl-CoA reductase/2-hydroxyglutaryl-CoA dehydratase subunit BcrC/BadD/HgdB